MIDVLRKNDYQIRICVCVVRQPLSGLKTTWKTGKSLLLGYPPRANDKLLNRH